MIASPLSAYIHLPWCVSKCPYCDFNSHTAPAGLEVQQASYIDALKADIRAHVAYAWQRPIQTVFLGGGTPSLFSPDMIADLLLFLREQLAVDKDAEITMEANPGTLEYGSFEGYRQAGINRLSIGAQSFDAGMLASLGRIHSPEDTRAAVRQAEAAGFERINIDLMYGLPEQSPADAISDVDAALALGVSHVSHYQLTLEPNTRFHAFPPALPDEDTIAAMAEQAARRFAAGGLSRYEVSALSAPGEQCRHNLNYWQFGDYLAIGAGAHGKLTVDGQIRRYARAANPRAYIDQMRQDEDLTLGEVLNPEQRIFEFMLNALRLCGGFSLDLFESRTGCDRTMLDERLDIAAQRGLLACQSSDIWQPTALGQLFLNDLQLFFLPPDR